MDYLVMLSKTPYFMVSMQLVAATLFGAMIGYDRERIGKPAGVKTHSMVCMASCLIMAMGTLSAKDFGVDPNRLAAQVVSGMGFLCGGVIIVTSRNEIKGLTTAAGLWFAACIGLCIGSAYWWLTIPAGLCFFIITHFLPKVNIKREENMKKTKSDSDKLEHNDNDEIVS